MRKLGYEVGFISDLTVQHIGAVSERARDPCEMWRRKNNGLHLFWKKHYAPKDVARLVRRDLQRARFRMFLNGILAAVQPAHSVAWQKLRRYRATRDASMAFLSSMK